MVTCILKYRRNHPSSPDGPDRPVSENRWKSKANRAPRRLSDPNPTAHATSMVTRIMKRAKSPPTHPTVQIVPPPVDRFKRDPFPDRNHLIRRSNGGGALQIASLRRYLLRFLLWRNTIARSDIVFLISFDPLPVDRGHGEFDFFGEQYPEGLHRPRRSWGGECLADAVGLPASNCRRRRAGIRILDFSAFPCRSLSLLMWSSTFLLPA
ncbi:hypothetical protein BHM03_00028210 [Ensete ventricosum]|nr:hypothetical protein BHM03_00028210 [Ensete ventricosum]